MHWWMIALGVVGYLGIGLAAIAIWECKNHDQPYKSLSDDPVIAGIINLFWPAAIVVLALCLIGKAPLYFGTKCHEFWGRREGRG